MEKGKEYATARMLNFRRSPFSVFFLWGEGGGKVVVGFLLLLLLFLFLFFVLFLVYLFVA